MMQPAFVLSQGYQASVVRRQYKDDDLLKVLLLYKLNEHRHEKTFLGGFRPGKTKTGFLMTWLK